MSLDSAGFLLEVGLLTTVVKPGTDDFLPAMPIIQATSEHNDLQAYRVAFLGAMAQFASSEHFAACVHGLRTQTTLVVRTHVNL